MARYFSPHLINEPPLLVLPSLAAKVGINHAILLQQMHYWLRGSKHEHDGHTWVYNSYAEWQKQLPWLTVRGVRKVIGDLERDGYIVSGTFNRMAFDKTKWYRIDYAAVCGIEQTMCHEVSDDGPEMADDVSSGDTSEVAQSDTPIPETTQETTNTHSASAQKGRDRLSERFDRFWSVYPRKKAKGDARARWSKIKPSEELTERMIAAVEAQCRSTEWQEDNGKYIPYPATWLNQERWEDEDSVPTGVRRNGPPTDDPRYYGTEGMKRWREEQAEVAQ